jgi:hypothetical protein
LYDRSSTGAEDYRALAREVMRTEVKTKKAQQ